jgi:uncharacterized protein YegP (UPF0339 family)
MKTGPFYLVIYRGALMDWRFSVRGNNNERIAHGQGYRSRESVQRVLELMFDGRLDGDVLWRTPVDQSIPVYHGRKRRP